MLRLDNLYFAGLHLTLPAIGQLNKDILQIRHQWTNLIGMHPDTFQFSLKLELSDSVLHQRMD